jgi:hypothetical protein
MKIERTKLLIVEGTHEVAFFEALMRARGIPSDPIQVLSLGGKTNLFRNIETLKLDAKFADVVTLAIVRDADISDHQHPATAAQRALQAVQGCLRNAGMAVPNTHAALASGRPSTAIFVMPDGRSDGSLESLCVRSVEQKAEFDCVQKYFECLARGGIIPGNAPKAFAHAWIASRPQPDAHTGVAARNGDWELRDPAFDQLSQFLTAL